MTTPTLSVLPDRTVELATALACWIDGHPDVDRWVTITFDTLDSVVVFDTRDRGEAITVTAWSDDQWNVTDPNDLGGFEPYTNPEHAIARAVDLAGLRVDGRHP